MTKLRSFSALLLAAAMLLCVFPAAAEKGDPVQFTVETSYDLNTRLAEVSVKVSGSYQAHSMTARLRYDSSCLSVKKLAKLDVLKNCPDDAVTVLNESAAGEIAVGFICATEPISDEGYLFKATFDSHGSIPNDIEVCFEIETFVFYPVGGEEQPIEYDIANDFIHVYVEPTETPVPTAAPEPTVAPDGRFVGWYFETDPEAEGWTFVDADGDAHCWKWAYDTEEVIEGRGSIYSCSWTSDVGSLEPDNWAVSPAFKLPHGISSVEFTVKSVDSEYSDEHFAVFAGPEDDPLTLDEIMPETLSTGETTTYRLDLTDYRDETIRIAFRHFNSTDQYEISLDCVQVYAQEGAVVDYVGVYTGVDCVPFGGDAELPVFEDGEGLHYAFTVNGEPWDGKCVTSDVTVAVDYEIDRCTAVFYDPIDDAVIESFEVEYNGAVIPPEAPEHEHYTFIGWDGDPECVTGNTVFTAIYEAETFTVIFTDGQGNELASYSVGWSSPSPEPETPVLEGWTFAGWDADISCVTEDMTVNATWIVNHIVGFFDGMGHLIAEYEVPDGSPCPEPEAPVREGWTFIGWDTDISCVTDDMAVNATWSRNYYTVTFSGYYSGEEVVEHGADCPLPVCDIEGCHFVFRVDGELWDGSCVTSDLNVRVTVTVDSYVVTFLDWDGTLLKTQRVNHGRSAVPPVDPVREGYVFTGWDTDFACITGDTVVIATYHSPEFTLRIVYLFEDGSEAAPEYAGVYAYLDGYSVESPAVEGYTPDIPVVEGIFTKDDVSVTVTYKRDVFAGDVDGDGLVTMADVTILSMYLNGEDPEISEQGMFNADANGDGGVDIRDIAAIYGIISAS